MEGVFVQKKTSALTESRRWGFLFLLAAYSVFFAKCLPAYWPVISLGLLGSVCTFWFEKKGFIFALSSLGLSVPILFYSSLNPLWFLLFFLSMALSWFLIYSEAQELFFAKKEKEGLLTQMQAEKKHFNTLYLQSEKARSLLEKALEPLHQENATLRTYSRQLESQKISSALEESVDEPLRLSELERQYAELKNRFEEKAAALDAARKEAFKTEGALILLQKQGEEKNLESDVENNIEMQELHLLEEEREALVAQVAGLEELVSLLIPFARTKLKIV